MTMQRPAQAELAAAGGGERREAERVAELRAHGILDTPPEQRFDAIAELARLLFDTPAAAVSLIDSDRQWVKAAAGMPANNVRREDSFCAHVIGQDGVLVVPDATQDRRFSENPLVTGAPYIRFYAGAPLRSETGHNLGAVCVISADPREDMPAEDRRKLDILASIASRDLELRRQARQAKDALGEQAATLRDAQLRLRHSADYADLLAEVQASETSTEKLHAVAMAAWQQYTEAGGVLVAAIRSLRSRMTHEEYAALVEGMPGFML
jgi:GAF domain-containing protein